jgi:hypothetical protein
MRLNFASRSSSAPIDMAETNWLLDTSILIDILRGRVPARNLRHFTTLPGIQAERPY